MSDQSKSLPEASSAHQPRPAQTPAVQGEKIEQEATVETSKTPTRTEAPTAIAEDKDDTDQKFPPHPSIFDAGNSKTLKSSSVGGDRIPVDSPEASSGEMANAGMKKKDPRPATVPIAKKPGAVSAGVVSVATSDTGVHRQKDPRPVPRYEAISAGVDSAGAADSQRRKDLGLSRGVAPQGTAAAREKESSSGGTASVDPTASWIRRKDPRPVPSPTPDIPELSDDEPSSYQHLTNQPASHKTPGAVGVPGINSDDNFIQNADPEPEQDGQAQDIALNVEAVADSRPPAPINAHVVNDRGQETGTRRNTPADDVLRDHLFANVLVVSSDAVQEHSENPDAHVTKCSPRDYSRRSWAMLALLVATIFTAATLMGVLIPQESTGASQDGIQGSQQSGSLSSIPTTAPTLLPSLAPSFDPETVRFHSIQSILVPISGAEALLDTSTPQYRALEWVSCIDPLRLPYNTEAERKRMVQRYVLAVFYYACGGQHWLSSHHFLEGIHECDWWSFSLYTVGIGGSTATHAHGAVCTKGREVGEVDHLVMGNSNLTGTLPVELQYLSDLEELDISGNKIGGPIPGVFGNMKSLKTLELQRSSFTGIIPKSFGNLTSLQSLDLSFNMLNGTILSELGQLSSLRSLYLHGNRFTGEIPNKICSRRETGNLTLWVDSLTAYRTEFLCECISVVGLSGCCVVRPNEVGNGRCSGGEPYNTAACGWDGGDCLVEGLPECLSVNPFRIGNGICDVNELYNTEACGYDGGDCCESTCKGSRCGNNGFDSCKDPTVNITCLDAEGLEGCCVEYPSQIGDGYCHPYEPYYTKACKYDQGDCPEACPEGTSPTAGKNMSACCVWHPGSVGNGYCDNYVPYNAAACGWDGGDCCESTCEGLSCGRYGFNCKDPNVNVR